MGLFEANGYQVTHDSANPQGEIVVVNTCGFIADAKEESINTILEQVALKNDGQVERIYVMGCLSERYLADLEAEIPEVDGWYGKFNFKQLLNDLKTSKTSEKSGNELVLPLLVIMPTLKSARVATVIVLTAPSPLSLVVIRVVPWKRFSMRCASW